MTLGLFFAWDEPILHQGILADKRHRQCGPDVWQTLQLSTAPLWRLQWYCCRESSSSWQWEWCLCLSPVFGEPLERVVGSIWAVGPGLRCFVHFDFEMCFAPQRRALFRHLNCQKWSAPGVLCAFWLRNVLRATTACTFSISQLPKVLRDPGVLYILTCKCASRHNGVQFFISDLASWLRIRRFSEPTFRPSGAPDHWKNTVFQCFATFRPFLASASSFFLLFLFYSSFF